MASRNSTIQRLARQRLRQKVLDSPNNRPELANKLARSKTSSAPVGGAASGVYTSTCGLFVIDFDAQ